MLKVCHDHDESQNSRRRLASWKQGRQPSREVVAQL